MFKEIASQIKQFSTYEPSKDRRFLLQELIDYIQAKKNGEKPINLNFVCTHNSRRSHLSQIWAQTLASYFGISNIYCYSGGTEATALFPKVVDTLRHTGFNITKLAGEKNPIYAIKYGPDEMPVIGFSKTYDDPFNPVSNFAAIMTCSHADENCPFIPGAEKRIPLTFDDPKAFDGTDLQTEKYRERSLEIAAQLYYVFSRIDL